MYEEIDKAIEKEKRRVQIEIKIENAMRIYRESTNDSLLTLWYQKGGLSRTNKRKYDEINDEYKNQTNTLK